MVGISFRFAAPVLKVPLKGRPASFICLLFIWSYGRCSKWAGKKIKGDREGDRSFYIHPIGEPDQERAGEVVVVGGDKPSVRAVFVFFIRYVFFTPLWLGWVFVSFFVMSMSASAPRHIASHSIASACVCVCVGQVRSGHPTFLDSNLPLSSE